jgi:hypothetical protein
MHTPSHTLDKSNPSSAPLPAWAPLWRRGLQWLAQVSPWLMALGLTGAYVTADRSEWVGLNLTFCIGMVVVALLRFWHVLSEPMPGSR